MVENIVHLKLQKTSKNKNNNQLNTFGGEEENTVYEVYNPLFLKFIIQVFQISIYLDNWFIQLKTWFEWEAL